MSYTMKIEMKIGETVRPIILTDVKSFDDNEGFIILNLKDGGILYLNKSSVISFLLKETDPT